MNKIRYMLYFLLFVFSVTLNGKNPVLEKPNPPDLFCAAPTHRYIEVADGDNAYFVVDGLTCGTCHLVQIRVMGTQSWTITARNNGSDFQGIWASGLTPNTNYEYRAGTECEVTTYGPIGWFNSSGGAQNFVPTTCSDNIKNQGETGVDCGGPCEACASCNDGIQNQGETGVDCGGPCSPCATCEDGIQNQGETGVDCGGPCTPCATCEDGIQNGNETGVDCGGNCTPCASCQDGIQNGDETGVDCGGTLCEPCPTCFDGIQNQGETGLDCGGPCEPCGTCEDGVKSPGEVGIDCGGSCTPCQCVVPTPKYVEGIDMDRGNQGYLVWSHQAITPANFHLQIRIQGSSDWYTFTNIPGESYSAGGGSYGYSVRGLSAHTIYEWRIKAFCTHADYESDWSEICQFNSSDPAGYSLCDQPCMAPQQLSVDIQESQTQSVFTSTFSWSWSGINPYAYAFLLEIREAGTPNWENNVVSQWEGTNYYPEPGYYQTSITVLGPTTMYEWRVSVKCNSEEDEWVASEVGQFTTLGGTCFDGVQNQGEEGIDCGGPSCDPCTTCFDGIQNQGEYWVDGGGPCSSVPPTPALKYVEGIVSGQAYLVWTHLPMDEPYWNGFYYTIRIRATGTEHWTEFQAISYDPEYYDFPSTFIEGDTYGFLVRGLPRNTDLEWQVRARFSDLEPSEWSEICQFNSSDPAGMSSCDNCFDGIQNGDETGVDCGGNYCTPCASCEDGVQNGDETGVDCGGSCTPCASCEDGVQNGDETGVDCGGTLCEPCPTCYDGIQNQGEYWVDGGGPCSSVPPTPALKYVEGIVSGQAYLVWTHLPMDEPYWNGFYYTIRIRATGTEHWTEFQAISYDPEYYDFPSTFIEGDTYGFLVRGLPRNTDLEWQVRARFSDLEPSEWSEICQFNSSDPAGYSNCSLPCNAPNALYANFSPTGETFTTGLGWANLDNDPFSYLVEIREAGTTDWDNNIVSQLITNPTFWPSPGFYYAEVELQIQKIYEWRVSIKCSEEGEWIPSEVADLSTNPYSIKKPGSGIVNNNKPLGIANLAELEVFPNPASNLLNVNIPLLGSSDGLLSLLDYTGRTVIAQPINANEMSVEWDVSSLPKGLYMVQLRNQGNIKMKRIIIQ